MWLFQHPVFLKGLNNITTSFNNTESFYAKITKTVEVKQENKINFLNLTKVDSSYDFSVIHKLSFINIHVTINSFSCQSYCNKTDAYNSMIQTMK